MRMRGFRILFALAWVLVLVLPWGLSFAAEIKDIRMYHAPDRSRIVFDMDEGVVFNVFTLNQPNRVVIDLPAVKLKSELQNHVPISGTTGQFISAIRFGSSASTTSDSSTLRAVFDVQKPVRYFIQLLKPVDNYQHRLVIDYYHQDAVVEADKPAKSSAVTLKPKIRKLGEDVLILIDPGHGGEDPGALGSRSQEKVVVLAIARKLKTQIDKQPGMRAQMTRSGDYYISLRKRTRIAREKGADIFISIHADAFKSKKARGASVYALSARGASSENARWLANKENASDLIGGVSLADKDNLLAGVLLDLSMTKTNGESLSLGRDVLEELKKIGRVHSKMVEQAGFAVLKSPDIPSILVETAYITNPAEEKLLNSKRHQLKIANAIVAGVRVYLDKNQSRYVN